MRASRGCSYAVVVFLLYVVVGSSASAMNGASYPPWGDFGVEGGEGSRQFGIQKRLVRPKLPKAGNKPDCKLCAQYAEAWVEWDEAEPNDRDRDVRTIGLGYRYYLVKGDEKGHPIRGLAVYLRGGVSRVRIEDPTLSRWGSYGGVGVQMPLPNFRRKDGNLRGTWVNFFASVVHNQVSFPSGNADYLSKKIGLRFVIPSSHDREVDRCSRAHPSNQAPKETNEESPAKACDGSD